MLTGVEMEGRLRCNGERARFWPSPLEMSWSMLDER